MASRAWHDGRMGEDTEAARRALEAPWWASCTACGPGTAWFGDTEEEVRGLVEEHLKVEHVRVWKNRSG